MSLPVENFAHDSSNNVSATSSKSNSKRGSLQLPCPDDSQQPLTVFVKHNVLRTKHAEFEAWCNEINALAQTYDGFISTEVIKPVCNTDIRSDEYSEKTRKRNSESDEYISIVRFQNYTLLKKWIDSDDRRGMLQRTNEFSNTKSVYTYHSLEHWFPSNINGTNGGNTLTGSKTERPPGPPPKWKMLLFTTIVIYIQTLWIPKVTNRIFPNLKKNAYTAGLLNTFLIVSFVTYIGFPIFTRLAAFWLFPHENYINKLKELIPKQPEWYHKYQSKKKNQKRTKTSETIVDNANV